MRKYLASVDTEKGHATVGNPLGETLGYIDPSSKIPYSHKMNDLHDDGRTQAEDFITRGNCKNWLTHVGQIFDLIDIEVDSFDQGRVIIRALKSASPYCQSVSETDPGTGVVDGRDCKGCFFNKTRSKIIEIYQEVPDS